jgi:crotonobetaine/carnitine-CoA ligase
VLDRSCLAPHALAARATAAPDDVVLEFVAGPRLTGGAQHAEVRRWTAGFRQLGIAPGAHVATMIPNSPMAYVAWLALGWLRATEVPLNTAYTGRMLQYALALSDATALVIAAEHLDRLLAVADQLPQLRTVVVVDGPPPSGPTPFRALAADELLAAGAATDVDDLEGPAYRDIAAMIFTSGTTGPSKGVLTPWAVVHQMWSWVPADAVRPGEGLYCALPMFHISGRSAFTAALLRGARYVTRDRFSVAGFWDDVRAHGCAAATTVGPLTALLHAQPPRDDDADNPLRAILLGPMIPDIEGFERRFGVRTATCYGQTEVGAVLVTGWDHGPWDGTGRPRDDYPWTELRIVDAHDEPVAPGEVGELVARTPVPWALNAGYHRMPEQTARAWRNGWFHTGDAFRVDADGWYHFVDRMQDTIRRRGENISSFEVENFVTEHPGVVDCAAVGVRTELGDDEVLVHVVAHDPATFDPADLIAFLVPRMPRFMVPRYVEVVDDLPRNETSARVRKAEVRARGLTPTTWDREAPSRASPQADM